MLDDDFEEKVAEHLAKQPTRQDIDWIKVIEQLRAESKRDIDRAGDALIIDRDPSAAMVFRITASISNRLAAAYEAGLETKKRGPNITEPSDSMVTVPTVQRKQPRRTRDL